jgi:hypothetical protein
MIISLLLLQAAAQMPVIPPPPPPPLPAVTSCNVGIAMFAPRSDSIDEKAASALGKMPPEALSALATDGVKLMVLPHPVLLDPVDPARQRAIAEARGQKIKAWLAAHGYPADRIGIRPADVDPKQPDNWGDGVLLMVEAAPEIFLQTRLSTIC